MTTLKTLYYLSFCVFILNSYSVKALTPNFDGTVGTFTTTLIGTGFGATNDLTTSLQGKIDLVSSQIDGGTIVISGNVQLSQVTLKSNVHVNILKGTVIKVSTNSEIPLFDVARGSTTHISNVKFYCGNCDNTKPVDDITQKYTIDLSDYGNKERARVFMLGNVTNFWISDMYVKDNYTKFATISLNGIVIQTSTDNSVHRGLRTYNVIAAPTKGDIRNIYGTNFNNGYGVVQVECATNVCFEKLSGVGGVTLRLESDAMTQWVGTENGRKFGVTQGIRASDLYDKNGFSCVTLCPHGRINKDVYIENVYSTNCCFGVNIVSGFFDKELFDTTAMGVKYLVDPLKFKKGYFSGPVVIKNVHSTYGINAIGRKKEYDYVEKSIRLENPWGDMSIYMSTPTTRIIPSVASVGYFSLPNANSIIDRKEGEYNVTIDGPITSSGFNPILTTKYGNVLYEDDRNMVDASITDVKEAELLQNNLIKVYPIPAHDFVSINHPMGSKIDIYDCLGKMRKSVKTNGFDVSRVDVSALSKGTYVIHVYDGKMENKVKLIKN